MALIYSPYPSPVRGRGGRGGAPAGASERGAGRGPASGKGSSGERGEGVAGGVWSRGRGRWRTEARSRVGGRGRPVANNFPRAGLVRRGGGVSKWSGGRAAGRAGEGRAVTREGGVNEEGTTLIYSPYSLPLCLHLLQQGAKDRGRGAKGGGAGRRVKRVLEKRGRMEKERRVETGQGESRGHERGKATHPWQIATGRRSATTFDPFSLDMWDPFQVFGDFRPSKEVSAVASTQIDWKETPDVHIFKADLPAKKKKKRMTNGIGLNVLGEASFVVSENAKADEIKAAMENGVLTVTVPKQPQPKPQVKSIEISG
eukprot:Gb_22139 [translate_table: standard]